MTQDEVDLIYGYLHENYLYEDGELIAKKTKRGCKEKQKLGSFNYTKGVICIRVQLKINNKKYNRTLAQFVFLYHHKLLPSKVRHLDGNITNNKIENLILYEKSKSNECRDAKGYTKNKIGYRVNMTWDKKKQTYGNFINEEVAKQVFYEIKELRYINKLSHQQISKIINEKYYHYMCKNNKIHKGYKVRWGKYIATMKIKNKDKHIGIFNTPEEAHEAYLKAKKELSNK